jgi:lipid-A-disaccharide synthase-like uncharacterized protein
MISANPKSDVFPTRIFFLIWLALSLFLIATGWTNVVWRAGPDPDDHLRMVQLRDFLNGQSWFDTAQYRMNAPQGAPVHWSRLIELPLAFVVLLFSPLFGQPVAEMIAGAAMPMITLGLAVYFIAQTTLRLASRETAIVAIITSFCSIPILVQFQAMRIDHHGWQIVMACLSYYTFTWTDKKRAGIVLGLAMAVWTHISLEGLPLTAAFFIILGWRWIFEKAQEQEQGQRLFWTIGAFASGVCALYFATQRDGLRAIAYCDTVSPPHIAAALIAAIIMLPGIAIAPKDWRIRLGMAVLAGTAALGVLLMIAPQCARGAFSDLDPLVRRYWYENVSEGLPIWHQDWDIIFRLYAGPACGLIAALILWQRGKITKTPQMGAALFFMVYSCAVSILVFRTVSVAAIFAVPIMSILIADLRRIYTESEVPAHRVGMAAAALLLLSPGVFAGQLFAALQKPASITAPQKMASNEACESPKSVMALSKLPIGRMDAPFDMGPLILLTTPHSILASSHHRNQEGMHGHIEIFRSEPAKSHSFVQKHGINYIVFCPNEEEIGNYVIADPKGLAAALVAGKIPGWLERLPDVGEGIHVWRVKP